MRLVDGEQAGPYAPPQQLEREPRRAFGRDVKQTEPPGGDPLEGLRLLFRRLERVEGFRRNAPALQVLHLILHERHQRGDHDGEAAQHERGDLEADGLAAAGRQDGESVPTGKDGLDHPALERAKVLEAVVPVKLAPGFGDALGELGHPARLAPGAG
jgi:hypothetical protein